MQIATVKKAVETVRGIVPEVVEGKGEIAIIIMEVREETEVEIAGVGKKKEVDMGRTKEVNITMEEEEVLEVAGAEEAERTVVEGEGKGIKTMEGKTMIIEGRTVIKMVTAVRGRVQITTTNLEEEEVIVESIVAILAERAKMTTAKIITAKITETVPKVERITAPKVPKTTPLEVKEIVRDGKKIIGEAKAGKPTTQKTPGIMAEAGTAAADETTVAGRGKVVRTVAAPVETVGEEEEKMGIIIRKMVIPRMVIRRLVVPKAVADHRVFRIVRKDTVMGKITGKAVVGKIMGKTMGKTTMVVVKTMEKIMAKIMVKII
jgi:hypothetical protein